MMFPGFGLTRPWQRGSGAAAAKQVSYALIKYENAAIIYILHRLPLRQSTQVAAAWRVWGRAVRMYLYIIFHFLDLFSSAFHRGVLFAYKMCGVL